ncbi:MAG TPA: diguanylate cyclase [Candidatus Limnocylindrales bacterium]|nr:diguanylate cyclase [Candidatus Limnocylindrales bacterium]
MSLPVFGSSPRPRRPLLLVLVYGAFLALVGITATAQAVMVSAHFRNATLNDVVGSDAATTRAFVNAHLSRTDFDAAGPSRERVAALEAQLATLTRQGELLRVEIRRPDGTVVAASEPGASGVRAGGEPAFEAAARGAAQAEIVPVAEAAAAPGAAALPAETLIREDLPIEAADEVRGVVVMWRDAGPVLARLADVRRDVVLVTLSAALIAAALLFLIFRAAQARLTRQTVELVESTRRDPLTGSLNHGALVAHLADEIERARDAGLPLGVALVDVDNFRLLNDIHGHDAGDQALLAVHDQLGANIPEDVVVGRYGPDEFLLVAPAAAVAELEPAIDRLRTALADLSLQFEATERLPVTISAGVATYPDHGASVTLLLAAVARTLQEAKASGGDAVRVAGIEAGDHATSATFDVLQGLVHAVDTKDRYTKRHSEDVARYAVFLAGRVGAGPELIATIQVAGLLHDVGKIGIPDHILRKPGKLTEAEFAIVRQHVALGDAIVRDLPDIDVVRAGIRHHHERWDGDGYLDRLAGEEIPLIARILAVGDAFSAMTTTRPYRKALDIREALQRLEDAAGSQLDETLVRAFVEGMETAENAPLPGAPTMPALWTPRVA